MFGHVDFDGSVEHVAKGARESVTAAVGEQGGHAALAGARLKRNAVLIELGNGEMVEKREGGLVLKARAERGVDLLRIVRVLGGGVFVGGGLGAGG